jgi:hypothetical protein
MYPTCSSIAFMPLPLPGERERPHLLEALLAAAVVLGLASLGCGTPARTRRLPPSIFQAARIEARGAHQRAPKAKTAPRSEGAALVERTLHDAGLRFGTDGSARALWGYMRSSHDEIAPAEARPGDVVFFDTHGTGEAPSCADHAGLVESAETDGRLGFVEARGGQVRHSFVNPAQPAVRRSERGAIANSFLRTKQVSDPPQARYFAGEMLCGVFRVRR